MKSSEFYKSSPGDADVWPELRTFGLGDLWGKNKNQCRSDVGRHIAVSSCRKKIVAFGLGREDLDIENRRGGGRQRAAAEDAGWPRRPGVGTSAERGPGQGSAWEPLLQVARGGLGLGFLGLQSSLCLPLLLNCSAHIYLLCSVLSSFSQPPDGGSFGALPLPDSSPLNSLAWSPFLVGIPSLH